MTKIFALLENVFRSPLSRDFPGFCRRGSFAILLCCAGSVLITGCKMTAPMHMLRSPKIAKAGPVRIAVAPVAGQAEVAERLQQAIETAQPQQNRMLAVMHPRQLEQVGGIRLVSYDGQPSDMASLGAARRAGVDYVLQGSIVEEKLTVEPPNPKKRFAFFKRKKDPVESMTVRWTVMDVATGSRVADETITMDREQADKLYPDLAYHAPAGDAKVLVASARQSWSLVAPTTKAEDVMLDLPWFMPGSSQVRKGNGFARQGRWELAEQEWQNAADSHPWNEAAWKNLSIAAVSREDFTLARDRLKHANTSWPGDPTFSTLMWIESKQKEYHNTLGLPPPVGGWTFPDPPKVTRPEETQAVKPKDLDQMPWWTAIPFMPPPGWTWKQWLTQPIVL